MHAKPVLMSQPAATQDRVDIAADRQRPGRPISPPGRLPLSRVSSSLDALSPATSPRTASPHEREPAGRVPGRLSRAGSAVDAAALAASGRVCPERPPLLSKATSVSRPSSGANSRFSSPEAWASQDAQHNQIIAVAEAIAQFEQRIQEEQDRRVSKTGSASPEAAVASWSRRASPRPTQDGSGRPDDADGASHGASATYAAMEAAHVQRSLEEASSDLPQSCTDDRHCLPSSSQGTHQATEAALPSCQPDQQDPACSQHCRRAVSQAVDTPLSHAEAAEPPADGREHSAACTAGCQQDGPVTDAAEAAADTKDASAAGWAWASRRRRHRKDAKAERAAASQAEAGKEVPGMQQRAAMLAHQVAVDRAARAFYGSARDGLQHDAACALRSANAALERCHDIEPSLDIVWELKDAVYQLRTCLVSLMEQHEIVLGGADPKGDEAQAAVEMIEPICYCTTSQEVLQDAFLAQKAELVRQDAEIARAAERVQEVERQRRWSETVQRKDIARLVGALQAMQAAEQARVEEVHFSRGAWLDMLRRPDASLAHVS